ncbi:MAG: nucleotidyltransferase family protein [bacterium]
MTRQQVTQILAAHERELRGMGVKSLALFGSLARDEATDSSDVDLLVEFDRPIGYFHFFDVQEYLQKLIPAPKVDLVMRDAVYEELKEDIYAEALDVL